MRAVLVLCLLAAPAQADCLDDPVVFSCQVGKKTLEICHGKGALIYKFGPEAKPDLTIAEPLETVAFTPWPGAGRYIWETVAFTNDGHVYEVWTSFERDPEASEGLQAGVRVQKGNDLVAELACDQGTASNSLDVIFELKESVGQCWDFDSQSWQRACN
jgi:hypothetical protein